MSYIFDMMSNIKDGSPRDAGTALSFQEKSLWLMFVSLAGVYTYYFVKALEMTPFDGAARSADVSPIHVAMFGGVVAMLVATQVVGSILISIGDRRTDTDERDRLIGLRGTRNGAYVLATGVFVSLCAALVTSGNFVFTHLLLAFWVASQLVEIGTQLRLYRRGV